MLGRSEDEQLMRGMRTGELPFLRKPFAARELLDAISRTLRSQTRSRDPGVEFRS